VGSPREESFRYSEHLRIRRRCAAFLRHSTLRTLAALGLGTLQWATYLVDGLFVGEDPFARLLVRLLALLDRHVLLAAP
jgi:hypothetical protein